MSDRFGPDIPLLVEIRCGGKNGRCGRLLADVYDDEGQLLVVWRDGDRFQRGGTISTETEDILVPLGCSAHFLRVNKETRVGAIGTRLRTDPILRAADKARRQHEVQPVLWTPWDD